MSSSIIALLKNKILTSENYGTWKSNLNMILVIDDLCFVLMEEHPSLARNASLTVRDTYDSHYILANMSDVLSKKHESMVTAHKIMDSFQEIFRQPSIQLHHEAIKYVYNACMKEDQPVKEHILNMMVHLKEHILNISKVRCPLSLNIFRRASFNFIVMRSWTR